MSNPKENDSSAPHSPPKWLLPIGALACAIAWGSAFPGVKFLYRTSAEIGLEVTISLCLLLAGARFTLAGLMLIPLSKNLSSSLRRAPWKTLLLFGALQTYLQYVLFYTSMNYASGTLGSLLTVSGNFFWVILSPLLLKSPWPRPAQWMLLVTGAVGVIWAVAAPGAGAGRPVIGALFFLGATFCGALALIILQSLRKHIPTNNATCLSLLGGGIALLLTAFPAWGQFTALFSHRDVLYATLYLAGVSAVGFSVWNYLTTLFAVNVLAAYRFVIPIAGIILSTLFIPGESPGAGIYGGGVLVILAVIGLQRYQIRPVAGVR